MTAGQSDETGSNRPSDASTDAELLHAAALREEGAWAILVRRYDRLVYSVPIRAGLNEADAADITQSVFLRLFGHVARIRDPQALPAWLLTTARRQTWAKHREREAISLPLNVDVEDQAATPADELERLESQHRIRMAVAELGDPCQKLLEALFFDNTGRDYANVAKRLGVSVGSIGPSRARCFERLRLILGRYGVLDKDHGNS